MKIKLNPDQEIVNTIREGLKRTGGYCPCRRERTEATKCMCQEFKDQIADPNFEGFCHCIYMRKSPAFAGLFRQTEGLPDQGGPFLISIAPARYTPMALK